MGKSKLNLEVDLFAAPVSRSFLRSGLRLHVTRWRAGLAEVGTAGWSAGCQNGEMIPVHGQRVLAGWVSHCPALGFQSWSVRIWACHIPAQVDPESHRSKHPLSFFHSAITTPARRNVKGEARNDGFWARLSPHDLESFKLQTTRISYHSLESCLLLFQPKRAYTRVAEPTCSPLNSSFVREIWVT